MSRTSRLLLAPAAAFALIAFSTGTASADDPLPTDSGALLQDVTGSVTEGLSSTEEAPGAGTGLPESSSTDQESAADLGTALPGADASGLDDLTGGADDASQGADEPDADAGEPAEGAGDEPAEGEEAGGEEATPVATFCEELAGGLAGADADLAAELEAQCEADPEALVRDLIEGLLEEFPTDPAEGCQALIDLIDEGATELGLDAAPLIGLIEEVCALIPAPGTPGPTPKPEPTHPAPAVHPVAQPQHVQPAVVPVAHSGGTGGQLAYTGVDPKPYLFGGVAALGLGAGLLRLGRRRA